MPGSEEGFWHIVFLSIIEVYGDFSLRFYAQTNNPVWLGNGIVGYIGVVYYLIQSLQHNNVLYVNGMWDGVSGIIESIAAYFLLGDRLDKPHEYAGLVLTIGGVYLMKGGGGLF
jgi:multidrug transporter EmrE-like cation transporter